MIAAFPTEESLSKCRDLVVGDVILDRYWHAKRMSMKLDRCAPVFRVDYEEDRLGGAANVALNVKALGGQVTLLGAVGNDRAAIDLQGLLRVNAIAHQLVVDQSIATSCKTRVIEQSQIVFRADSEVLLSHERLAEIRAYFEVLLCSHDVLVLSDYGKGVLAEISELVRIARAAGKPTIIDPKMSNWVRYAGATLVTPNEEELAEVIGPWSTEEEFRDKVIKLRDVIGLQGLLVTKGENGMALVDTKGVTSLPAERVHLVDSTGAGDTVVAVMGLLGAFGLDMHHSMFWANRAAAIKVTKFGTAPVYHKELCS